MVVQHEGDPFGRAQRVQHDEQRPADRVGQDRLLFRLAVRTGRRAGGGHLLAEQVFTAGRAGAQHVQAHPGHDRPQPRGQVLHLADVGALETEPGFLDGVLRFAGRAEHPVGDLVQVAPLRLKPVGQFVAGVHWSPFLVAVRRHRRQRQPGTLSR
jgi:hypothetical protein